MLGVPRFVGFDLPVFQIEGSGAAENGDHDGYAAAVGIYRLNDTGVAEEGAVDDFHGLAGFVNDLGFGAFFFGGVVAADVGNLHVGHGLGVIAADDTDDAVDVLDEMADIIVACPPVLLVNGGLDEQVPGIELLVDGGLLALLDRRDAFRGHEDFANRVLKSGEDFLRGDQLHDFLLLPGECLDNEPVFFGFAHLVRKWLGFRAARGLSAGTGDQIECRL